MTDDLSPVLDLLRKVTMEVHAHVADVAREAGMSAVDIACLGIVRQSERDGDLLSAGALSHRLGLSPAATTAMLDRMATADLITRERSKDDARIVLVASTDKARELARSMFEPLNEAFATTIRQSPTSIATLQPMLQQLVDAAERARDRW